jgi:tRNA (guanine-N7-)-methyltransferase
MSAARPFKCFSPLRLDPDRSLERIDWEEVFGSTGPVEVEVGIGKGRFMLAAAQARPEVNMLGIEWANKYLRIAEERAGKRKLENVRFVRVDARELVSNAIPSGSVNAYYVFYPDPWPKKRHNKRRFFQPATMDHLARTLRPGCPLHIATDHADYWSVIEPLIDGDDRFERAEEFGAGVFPMPVDQPLTNFEAKYLVQGRKRFRATWVLRREC